MKFSPSPVLVESTINEANAFVASHSNTKAVQLDASGSKHLGSLVDEADVIISAAFSLIPFTRPLSDTILTAARI